MLVEKENSNELEIRVERLESSDRYYQGQVWDLKNNSMIWSDMEYSLSERNNIKLPKREGSFYTTPLVFEVSAWNRAAQMKELILDVGRGHRKMTIDRGTRQEHPFGTTFHPHKTSLLSNEEIGKRYSERIRSALFLDGNWPKPTNLYHSPNILKFDLQDDSALRIGYAWVWYAWPKNYRLMDVHILGGPEEFSRCLNFSKVENINQSPGTMQTPLWYALHTTLANYVRGPLFHLPFSNQSGLRLTLDKNDVLLNVGSDNVSSIKSKERPHLEFREGGMTAIVTNGETFKEFSSRGEAMRELLAWK